LTAEAAAAESSKLNIASVRPIESVPIKTNHDNKLKQFEIGKEIYKLEGHTHSVWCLVLLPKNQLASGSRDNTIRIWDMNKGKEIYKLEGHTDCVWCLVALPNNQLASGSWDEKIVIWDLIKGKEIYKLEGHTNRLYSLVVLPNNQLVSGSADNTIDLIMII